MADETAGVPAGTPAEADLAVRVRGVTKTYGIWSSPKARLAHPLLNMAAQVLPSSRLARSLEHRSRHMYRDFHALHEVSFDIRKGESWGFIGVNGSGKSTLLKIISGNLRPSSGWVEVDGKVAILDYGAGFNGEFTGRENVYLKASILGLGRRQIDARFASIAAFADIGEFIDQPVKTYSSGMSARLGFAIMAHVDADIMITDEALAVGDAFFVQKCMAHIRAFLRKGTFLFVSHSVNDVVSLCQKAVWLEHGRMRAIGSAKEVTEAYMSSVALETSQEYLGSTAAAAPEAAPPAEAPPAGETVLRQPALARLTNSRPPRVVRDPRLEYLNRSPLRNDIEIPVFDMDAAGYGVGGARIEDVTFTDEAGAVLAWVIGGEIVHLKIDVRAERELQSPIVGFQVKDRLGQTLFADNTYLITRERPFTVPAEEVYRAEFEFQMPLLPVGDYVIRAATAIGVEHENAMLHCLDNALLFRSTTSGARHGLVGVPMLRIGIDVLPKRSPEESNASPTAGRD
jgi:lipopolysaccharide transport system ATP-binding protein